MSPPNDGPLNIDPAVQSNEASNGGQASTSGTLVVEETPPTPAATDTPPAQEGFAQGAAESGNRTFTAEDIEKARRQEKDKLYGRMEELQAELRALREAEEAKKAEQEEAERRAVEEAERKAEEEMELRDLLHKKEQEWQGRFQELEAERERERAILEQERQYQALMEYRQRRIAEESEEIMPELRDMVAGNNEQEIEASLSTLKERTARILEQVAATQQQYRQAMPGPRVTAPVMGPVEQNDSGYKTVTAADIRQMDASTYAQHRDQLLNAASNKAREGGLYS